MKQPTVNLTIKAPLGLVKALNVVSAATGKPSREIVESAIRAELCHMSGDSTELANLVAALDVPEIDVEPAIVKP